MNSFSATLRSILTRKPGKDEDPEPPPWAGGHLEALCSVYTCRGEKLCQVAVSFPRDKPWLPDAIAMYVMTWQEFQDMLPPVPECPLWPASSP